MLVLCYTTKRGFLFLWASPSDVVDLISYSHLRLATFSSSSSSCNAFSFAICSLSAILNHKSEPIFLHLTSLWHWSTHKYNRWRPCFDQKKCLFHYLFHNLNNSMWSSTSHHRPFWCDSILVVSSSHSFVLLCKVCFTFQMLSFCSLSHLSLLQVFLPRSRV